MAYQVIYLNDGKAYLVAQFKHIAHAQMFRDMLQLSGEATMYYVVSM